MFKKLEISNLSLHSIRGGVARGTEHTDLATKKTIYDCHKDTNNNGKIDSGECCTIGKCKA